MSGAFWNSSHEPTSMCFKKYIVNILTVAIVKYIDNYSLPIYVHPITLQDQPSSPMSRTHMAIIIIILFVKQQYL